MDWVTTTQVLEDLKESNDILAWTSFRDHFYPVIFNFAKTLGLSATDAEDAAQETMLAFLKAFRNGKYDREKGQFSHWLFGVARRVILNFRKRLPRKHFIADNTTGTSFWDMVADENTVRHTWDTEWRYMVLERCLRQARMELDQKSLILLSFMHFLKNLWMKCVGYWVYREMLCTLQKVASCQNCVSYKKILRDLVRILSYELS